MALLNIIHAPNPIFQQKTKNVASVNEHVKKIANDMLETMYFEGAVGLGANMVGIDISVVVLDLRKDGNLEPYVMVNPEIIDASKELVEYEEASLSFPGISAIIKRPKKIKVKYLDLEDKEQVLEAEDFLARVIMHEVDYLRGVVFLDHLSKMKRDMLMKKMLKFVKHNPPHIHGKHCNH